MTNARHRFGTRQTIFKNTDLQDQTKSFHKEPNHTNSQRTELITNAWYFDTGLEHTGGHCDLPRNFDFDTVWDDLELDNIVSALRAYHGCQ